MNRVLAVLFAVGLFGCDRTPNAPMPVVPDQAEPVQPAPVVEAPTPEPSAAPEIEATMTPVEAAPEVAATPVADAPITVPIPIQPLEAAPAIPHAAPPRIPISTPLETGTEAGKETPPPEDVQTSGEAPVVSGTEDAASAQ